MKKLISAIFALISTIITAQDVTVFRGDYSYGKAEYAFYKNRSNDTVRHGKFLFTAKNAQTESGQFLNNLKVGHWTYNFRNGEILISGNYTGNLKNGVWLFHNNDTDRQKEYELTFRNDTLIGKIDIEGVKGAFDNDGRFIGNWTVNYGTSTFTAKFQDNLVTNIEWKEHNNIKGMYCAALSTRDFSNLSLPDNPVIRKEYEFDYNLRSLSNSFDVEKVYQIDACKANGRTLQYHQKSDLFALFFLGIDSGLNAIFDNRLPWITLQPVAIKVNPEVLYHKLPPGQEHQRLQNASPEFNLEKYYDQNLVDEKPVLKRENGNLIVYIQNNYTDFDQAYGSVILEFIVGKDGKAKVIKAATSGNISAREITRILENAWWLPGKKEAKPVAVKFSVPIHFGR